MTKRMYAACLVLAVLVAGCGGVDRRAVRRQAAGTATAAPAASGELLRLLGLAREQTYNARFAARSDDPEISAGDFVVEIWRRPPDVRYDTTSKLANQVARTTTIRRGGVVTRCEQPDGGTWTCERVAAAQAATFDTLLAETTEQVKNAAVTARDGVIAGRAAHCFTLTSAREDSREICLTADGIPVLISSPSGRFDLLNLTRSVPGSVFTPPA